MTETKKATLNILIEPSAKDTISIIASKHRVSLGHIVREAIYEYLEKHAPNGLCPECQSTEITKPEPTFTGWQADEAIKPYCTACGIEID